MDGSQILYPVEFDLFVDKEAEPGAYVLATLLAGDGWDSSCRIEPPAESTAAARWRFRHDGLIKSGLPNVRWFHPVLFVLTHPDGHKTTEVRGAKWGDELLAMRDLALPGTGPRFISQEIFRRITGTS